MSKPQSGSRPDVTTAIPLRRSTRDDIIKPLLRGAETYDSLLRKMAEQYDPDADGGVSDGS